MSDIFGWVAGSLGIVLSAIGLWLTVRYGRQANELLRQICNRLGLEGSGNR